MDPEIEITDAHAKERRLQDGPLSDHGGNPQHKSLFLFDHALPLATHAGEEPLSALASAEGAAVEDGHPHGQVCRLSPLHPA